MPELPEVETIRRELEPLLIGRRILRAKIHRTDIVGWPRPQELQREIGGLKIVGLGRRGKYLVLKGQRTKDKGPAPEFKLLIIHLRLSGHLLVRGSRTPRQRFERIRFDLSGGRALIFNEPRVLGRVYLVEEGNLPPVLRGLQEMGLEPIQPEFNSTYLRQKVGKRTACIKGLLLDQRIAAGIGNIYSDEALFRAGIRPTRPARRLKRHEYPKLARALRGVLHDGIRHLGTTMTDARYQRPGGVPGGFQKYLMVFDREGETCKVCGTTIKACRIGNRTSRYCPKCQK